MRGISESAVRPALQIRLLGTLTVLRDGAQVALPPSRKTRALLAYLAAVRRPQRRERLCEMFWDLPDDPRAALRWSLSRLRQVVGEAIEASRDTVALRPGGVRLDHEPAIASLDADLGKLGTGELEELAAGFRGPFLEDLSLPRCPEFEAWRAALAGDVERARMRVLRGLIDRHRTGTPERALKHARALRSIIPDPEDLDAEIENLTAATRRGAVARTEAVGAPPVPLQPGSQQIRYCASADGVQLAYAITGSGRPILKCANWMSDLQYELESSVWSHWVSGLSTAGRLIRYDQRGNGLSDRTVPDFSFEAQLADLEAVADAVGTEPFALLGISAGAGLSVAYAVRHPERVSHLILYGGRPRGWRLSGTPEQIAHRAAMVSLIRTGWGQDLPAFRQLFTSLFIPDATPEQMDWYNELQRRTVSPENAARLHEGNGRTDISALLPKVRTATLVLHTTGDALVPFELGRALAIGIPDARFVSLDSRNHILLAGEPAFQRFLEEVRGFVAQGAP